VNKAHMQFLQFRFPTAATVLLPSHLPELLALTPDYDGMGCNEGRACVMQQAGIEVLIWNMFNT